MSVEQNPALEDPGSSVRELPYVGGLDGLRAIAVVAVMLWHFSPKGLPAGFLGVDIFFVVSGFLISRLLIREIARTGQIKLWHFWARRIRRLLPALATVTLAVLIAAAITFSQLEMHDILAHALGTLFYVANWVFIARNNSYFAAVGRPSPFTHMWSLAVEEQFYLIFPIVCYFARGYIVRRPVRSSIIAFLLAIASTIYMAMLVSPLGDPSRAYLGTFSHSMTLFVGVSLGILAGTGSVWEKIGGRVTRPRHSGAIATVVGFLALAAVLATMWFTSDRTYDLYRGGFLLFGIATAVVVVVVAFFPASPLTSLLSTKPMVAIGLRSYSLYLWHWPVRVFIQEHPGFTGWRVFVARTVWSVALAEASYRFVERPFRTGKVAQRAGTRGAIAYFVALTVAAGVMLATVDRPPPQIPSNLAALYGTQQDPNVMRVDMFGDSTALVFGLAGAHDSKQLQVAVGGDARLGCGLVVTDHISQGRLIPNLGDCVGWQDRWVKILNRERNAVLAVMDGAWDVLDHRLPDGTVVKYPSPQWMDLVTSSVRDALNLLTSSGRDVYVFEVPCYGAGDPSSALPERGDADRINTLNLIYNEMAHQNPHVKIVHWRSIVCPGGKRTEKYLGQQLWQTDDVHLTEGGGRVIWRWWLPQIRRPH